MVDFAKLLKQRREGASDMAIPPKKTAPAPVALPTVDFGSLAFYTGGGLRLPEGRYAMEFMVEMNAFTKKDGTPGRNSGSPKLGVMAYCTPLDGGEQLTQFLSMGTKAHLSFAPDPNTGKGIIPIAGGLGANLPRSTGWQLFLNSLYDCGLPEGVFTNDLTVLDGIWVHTANQPEPEDRKGFGQAKTGEADMTEERKGDGLMTVAVEIIEGGKPWEGTGGIPTEAIAAPVAAPKAVVGRIAPKPAAKPVVAPVAAAPAGDEDVMTAAEAAVAEVLTAKPAGLPKLGLKTSVFGSITKSQGNEMAQAVQAQVMNDDTVLANLLGTLGYVIAGPLVKPQA